MKCFKCQEPYAPLVYAGCHICCTCLLKEAELVRGTTYRADDILQLNNKQNEH